MSVTLYWNFCFDETFKLGALGYFVKINKTQFVYMQSGRAAKPSYGHAVRHYECAWMEGASATS